MKLFGLTPDSIQAHINDADSFTTSDQVCKFILNKNMSKELYDLFGLMQDYKLPVKIEPGDSSYFMAISDGYIALSSYAVKHANEPYFVEAFAHELVHAFTRSALDTNTEFANTINSLFKEANDAFSDKDKQALASADLYGLTNPKEFISEFMVNPRFRERLNTGKVSLYDRVVVAIKNLFASLFNTKLQGINARILS